MARKGKPKPTPRPTHKPTPWHVAFQRVEPYVVKITTPSAAGTGFLVALSPNKQLIGIATAAHVIDYPHFWEQPIRIEHYSSGKTVFLNHPDRFIETNAAKDTASIVLRRGDLPVPDQAPETISETRHLKVGVEVGWVGFPAIAPANLCFFSGAISSWVEEGFYFVDGVAINGVSGGPAFSVSQDNKVQIIGVVSAYVPNRATGIPFARIVRSSRRGPPPTDDKGAYQPQAGEGAGEDARDPAAGPSSGGCGADAVMKPGGLTTVCSGRSAARPAAEPER